MSERESPLSIKFIAQTHKTHLSDRHRRHSVFCRVLTEDNVSALSKAPTASYLDSFFPTSFILICSSQRKGSESCSSTLAFPEHNAATDGRFLSAAVGCICEEPRGHHNSH